MKTDAEIEAEEREKADREVQRLGTRGGGFNPLAGMTRRKMEDKEGPLMKVFAIVMAVIGLGIIGMVVLGSVIGSGSATLVIWGGMGFVFMLALIGLLVGIFVRVGRK